MKNIKIVLWTLSISITLFIGCSNLNEDIIVNEKKNEYVVGAINAKHKIIFNDYDKNQDTKNRVTIYTNTLNEKINFNLCNQNNKYIVDRKNLIKEGYNLEKIKNYDKNCRSYIELLEENNRINLRYGISFYVYYKPTGMNTAIPLTRHESRSTVIMEKTHKKSYTEGKYSYWKFVY